MQKGFQNSLKTGPILGFEVLAAAFEIHAINIKKHTSDVMISAAFVQAAKTVLKEANVRLMEPLMKLEINAEPEIVNELVQDLLLKRGTILDKQELTKSGLILLSAQAPLTELKDYSTQFRIVTSGKAYFGMELSHFEVMSSLEQNKAIKEITGFEP